MTGRELFKKAIDLLGLVATDGNIPFDADDLSLRAVSLINTVLAENASLDCRIRRTEHVITQITSLDESLGVSDIVANSVLPYGLALLFALGEDDALYAELLRRYGEARENALRFGKAKAMPITEVYS